MSTSTPADGCSEPVEAALVWPNPLRPSTAFEFRDGEWVLSATAKDDDPVSIRPFDAITFSLGDLWP